MRKTTAVKIFWPSQVLVLILGLMLIVLVSMNAQAFSFLSNIQSSNFTANPCLRGAPNGAVFIWDPSITPLHYQIDRTFSLEEQDAIRAAFDIWQNRTFASPNRRPVQSDVMIGRSGLQGIALHEIGHALGFGHPNLSPESSKPAQDGVQATNYRIEPVGTPSCTMPTEKDRDPFAPIPAYPPSQIPAIQINEQVGERDSRLNGNTCGTPSMVEEAVMISGACPDQIIGLTWDDLAGRFYLERIRGVPYSFAPEDTGTPEIVINKGVTNQSPLNGMDGIWCPVGSNIQGCQDNTLWLAQTDMQGHLLSTIALTLDPAKHLITHAEIFIPPPPVVPLVPPNPRDPIEFGDPPFQAHQPSGSHVLADVAPAPLQDLIDRADPGAVLVVPPGTYQTHLTITKSLTLDGQGQVTLNGDQGTAVVDIRAASHVTLRGFTIKNGWPGILVEGSSEVALEQNIITNNGGPGIRLEDSDGQVIQNTITDNEGWGIVVIHGAAQTRILTNQISRNKYVGIIVFGENQAQIEIAGNEITDTNSAGPWGRGIELQDAKAIVAKNIIHSQHNVGVIVFGGQVTLTDNQITENRDPGALNGRGVEIQNAQATLAHNVITGNAGVGLAIFGSTVQLSRNEIRDNAYDRVADSTSQVTSIDGQEQLASDRSREQ